MPQLATPRHYISDDKKIYSTDPDKGSIMFDNFYGEFFYPRSNSPALDLPKYWDAEQKQYMVEGTDLVYPTKKSTGGVLITNKTTTYDHTGYSTIYKKCDDKAHPATLLTVNTTKIAGFAKSDVPLEFKGLLINCTNQSIKPVLRPINKMPDKLTKLSDSKYILQPELDFDELIFDWTDRKAIDLTPEFWLDLVNEAIVKIKYPRINICCFGGHGRTGTAIACIVMAATKLKLNINGNKLSLKTPEKLITGIRKMYCNSAIEGKDQEAYIEYIFNVFFGK